jgi:hypothetical protein
VNITILSSDGGHIVYRGSREGLERILTERKRERKDVDALREKLQLAQIELQAAPHMGDPARSFAEKEALGCIEDALESPLFGEIEESAPATVPTVEGVSVGDLERWAQ